MSLFARLHTVHAGGAPGGILPISLLVSILSVGTIQPNSIIKIRTTMDQFSVGTNDAICRSNADALIAL